AKTGTTIAQVASSSDDAEEGGSGSDNAGEVYRGSTDLELVYDEGRGNQIVGIRFQNLAVPQNATITNAYLTFAALSADSGNSNSGSTSLTIRGEAADNAATFTSAKYSISNRPVTVASVPWNPPSWNKNTNYHTPSLQTVVQEIVNRDSWSSGNSMVFVITGYGSRSASSFDGSGNPPKLVIDWAMPDSPQVDPNAYPPTPKSAIIGTVRDNFDSVSYDNNNGSQNWAEGWVENDPESVGSSPLVGQVRIVENQLFLDDYPDTGGQPSAARRVDLSHAENATFRFDYATTSGVDSSDAVAVEVSYDGINFSHLETITGIKGSSSGSRSYDISGFRTANTTIRFRVANLYGGYNEYFIIDNVEISFAMDMADNIPLPPAAPQYSPVFVTWASALGVSANNENWYNPQNIIEPNGLGPDGNYGYVTDGVGAFGGFFANRTPGHKISKVELLLSAYAEKQAKNGSLKLSVSLAGTVVGTIKLSSEVFDNYVGFANAGTIVVDMTNSHNWQWLDFYNDLEIRVEQTGFKRQKDEYVGYDGIGLRVTAAPGVDDSLSVLTLDKKIPKGPFDIGNLSQAFPFAVRAPEVWNEAPAYLQGQDIAVAVVDSGVGIVEDLNGRRVRDINFSHGHQNGKDQYGHGTFVATVLAGDGKHSHGEFTGIAPKTKLVNVRVSDDHGRGTEGDVLQALQWIFDNAEKDNIRVVNLSLNAAVAQSYHTSPLAAGVEMLWLKGIVVVVSAGNNGSADLYPPANSPRVITVGATDDKGTPSIDDDIVAHFSAWGEDESGHTKPDLVAPGTNIIAFVPGNGKLTMGKEHPENAIDANYFRMSGTSMSAPLVTGAVAMLLQSEPRLTPDQVKFRLMATANKEWKGYDAARAGAGYLDIYKATHTSTTNYANEGLAPSELLRSVMENIIGNEVLGDSGFTWGDVNWNSVNWNSVNWNSGFTWSTSFTWGSDVNWNSVNWNSVNWNSVNWNSDFWDGSYATTQQVRNRLMPPVPLMTDEPEEEDDVLQIFLPAIQRGQ
ncbi:MAG: S8 family peptidase, partial [Caldilineaceae bacterium]